MYKQDEHGLFISSFFCTVAEMKTPIGVTLFIVAFVSLLK